MTKKTIWIIDQYAAYPEIGNGGGERHYYMSKELAKLGYKVYLIAASYHHILKEYHNQNSIVNMKKIDGFTYVKVKTNFYSHAHDKKRVLNWLLFTWRLLKLQNIINDKPDVIISSSPSPFPILSASKLSKIFNAKLVFEVRDIWPLTLKGLGKYSDSNPLIYLMQKVEDYAYKVSDNVLSNLPYSFEHMIDRGMDKSKFSCIPNGFYLSNLQNSEALPPNIKKMIPSNKFIIGYTGKFGLANALDVLIDSAKILKNREDIAFVLVGGGQEREKLKSKVINYNLENVYFIDPIPKKQVQSMISLFDVCYIGWRNDPIYRFGISPNKLPDYMLSSKPILHSFSGRGDYVATANAGFTVEAENPKLIAEAILKFVSISKIEKETLGSNGKKYILENHEYSMLASKLVDELGLEENEVEGGKYV